MNNILDPKICPKCMRSEFVELAVGYTHHICVIDPNTEEETGCGSQYTFEPDKKIMFPYNVIFANRNPEEIFRKPYLQLASVSMAAIEE